ncbi:HesA/MoeB/ThiF family protein [Myxococcaceae bacterium GXIMD 01537]
MSRLSEARVLVVGAGGLGCPVAQGLAHAGVGLLTLVDPDRVDVTNLHRQLWHRAADVGRLKVESAADGLRRAFPDVRTETLAERVDAASAEGLFRSHDLVVDATDGTGTKFLLSDAAVLTGVPLVYGGALKLQGQAMRVDPGGPCLRCLYGAPPPADSVPTCAQAGVLGSLVGLVGAVQAMLAVELLSGAARPEPGVGLLHLLDGASLQGRTVRVRREPECPACGEGRTPTLMDPEEAGACTT